MTIIFFWNNVKSILRKFTTFFFVNAILYEKLKSKFKMWYFSVSNSLTTESSEDHDDDVDQLLDDALEESYRSVLEDGNEEVRKNFQNSFYKYSR